MTAIYVHNQLPTCAIQTGFTLYELWHGRKLIHKPLRVWACIYMQVLKKTTKNMHQVAQKRIFIEYMDTTTQYRLYYPIGKRFVISHDVIFKESTLY